MGTLKFKRDILCHDRVPRRPTLAFWSSGDIFWHVRAHRRTVLGYVKVYRRPILARYELIGELFGHVKVYRRPTLARWSRFVPECSIAKYKIRTE